MVSASVSPGTGIMSRPSEQTLVMASSFSSVSEPVATAWASAASSVIGEEGAGQSADRRRREEPPFFDRVVEQWRAAAVLPGAPIWSMPIWCRISPTLSPILGAGASDRSTMPKATPKRAATSRPISSPTRVTRKAVDLISSAMSLRAEPGTRLMQPFEGPLDDAGTAHADVDHRVGGAFAVKSAGHEGVVLGRVGEDAELRAAEALPVGGRLRDVADFLSQEGDGRHVDAGLRRGGVHRGADALRRRPGRRAGFPDSSSRPPSARRERGPSSRR